MKKILIVGCGQLGSRHLQSLGSLQENLEIHLVDPSASSLERAESLFKEFEGQQQSLIKHQSLSTCPQENFFLIINATTSAYRLETLKNLKAFDIRYDFLVLEKVLFQKLDDYAEVENYIDINKTWVNCPRRMYSFYRDFKKNFERDQVIAANFTANNWGLCCNAVHYIDLIQFFSQEDPLSVDTSGLEKEPVSSKRDNYIEYFGSLSISFDKGSLLKLTCLRGDDYAPNLHIQQGETKLLVREVPGVMETTVNQKKEKKDIRTPYQSELTALLVEEFEKKATCSLATFEESRKAHFVLIEGLLKHYTEYSKKETKALPIT